MEFIVEMTVPEIEICTMELSVQGSYHVINWKMTFLMVLMNVCLCVVLLLCQMIIWEKWVKNGSKIDSIL